MTRQRVFAALLLVAVVFTAMLVYGIPFEAALRFTGILVLSALAALAMWLLVWKR